MAFDSRIMLYAILMVVALGSGGMRAETNALFGPGLITELKKGPVVAQMEIGVGVVPERGAPQGPR
jgi:hypothetical protein